jgi:hypothetical protein
MSGKAVRALNQALGHEVKWVLGGIAPLILNIRPRWRWIVSRLSLFNPRGNLGWLLGGPEALEKRKMHAIIASRTTIRRSYTSYPTLVE